MPEEKIRAMFGRKEKPKRDHLAIIYLIRSIELFYTAAFVPNGKRALIH